MKPWQVVTKPLPLSPITPKPLITGGTTLQELKRLDDALASYNQVIALSPGYAEAFHNRGIALHELKRLDEAIASYDQAIALKPDYAEGFYIAEVRSRG